MSNVKSLPTDLFIPLGLKISEEGYFFRRLSPKIIPILLVLIFWMPQVKADPHDHDLSWDWLLPISDEAQLRANLYSVDQGKLEVDRTAVVNKGQFHIVLPYQVHEIANTSQNIAVSLHLYGLARRR
jgi:predicted metal-dependent enzyme (double-stranded beta helix superfamily)